MNLPNKYEDMLRFNPHINNIEQAMVFIDEQVKYDEYKRLYLGNKPQTFNQRPPNHNFKRNPMNLPPQFSSPVPYENNFRQNNFPSQPINIQPRFPSQPQRFFTNQQVFGKPQNVFKPKQNNPNNNSQKPTPMSGVSTIPKQQFSQPGPSQNISRPNFPSWYQPKPFPKYIAQELHHKNLDPTDNREVYFPDPNEETPVFDPNTLEIPDQTDFTYGEGDESEFFNAEYVDDVNFP